MAIWLVAALGNTPTCVGKTAESLLALRDAEKHPHVRGEDDAETMQEALIMETPPRAWGRQS